jgi:peroxiredoxin Q/BCP
MSTAPAVGKKAPAFALENQDHRTVKLSDLKGKWVVLYFYPKDSTPGCTTEACDFTAGLKGFEKLDAVVLGCSADSVESHRKFIEKYKLKIDLLSDPDHVAMEAFGAWGEKSLYGRKFQGIIRSTVLIDPSGKVAHHWPKVKAAGHAEQVRTTLASLRDAASA